MPIKSVSETKQRLISAHELEPLAAGQKVFVKGKHLDAKNAARLCPCEVVRIYKDTVDINWLDVDYGNPRTVMLSAIEQRNFSHVGVDPFPKEHNKVQWLQFDLQNILSTLDIFDEKGFPYMIGGIQVAELNWNPYVMIGGQKHRYQRPFVWTLEQKQALITSIYNYVDCGKIIVRQRSHEELVKMNKAGETELAFHDIVDGKQRLRAIYEFMSGEITDEFGNHYGDLSAIAQGKFLRHQLIVYGYMREGVSDADVLRQFLMMNFSGVPQSPEHMKFVQDLYKKTE